MPKDYSKWKLLELRDELKSHGMGTSGRKSNLIGRLNALDK
jgi:hypothetical protein